RQARGVAPPRSWNSSDRAADTSASPASPSSARCGSSAAWARMPPFPDAGAALGLLREAGLAVGVLTNTATAAAEAALEAAGLRSALELVVGTDQVGAFKPDPRIYGRGCERAGCDPEEACLVAAHGWDVMGAARAGLRTGWVGRRERALSRAVPAPDVRGEGLLEVAEGVARLG
ncbi:MAG: HAD-IA family hydrolase, partial [Nocardioidaceae bacterium]